jgi:PAP_fibrillin
MRVFLCCYYLILSACSSSIITLTTDAFEISKLGRFFQPPVVVAKQSSSLVLFPIEQTKTKLLVAISGTANGKTASPDVQEQVLTLVAELEQNCPVSDTLLSNPSEAMALNGTWYLQYTSPSVIGDTSSDDDNDNLPVRSTVVVYRMGCFRCTTPLCSLYDGITLTHT